MTWRRRHSPDRDDANTVDGARRDLVDATDTRRSCQARTNCGTLRRRVKGGCEQTAERIPRIARTKAPERQADVANHSGCRSPALRLRPPIRPSTRATCPLGARRRPISQGKHTHTLARPSIIGATHAQRSHALWPSPVVGPLWPSPAGRRPLRLDAKSLIRCVGGRSHLAVTTPAIAARVVRSTPFRSHSIPNVQLKHH